MFSSNASQVSSDANYIEDVFSTYLYTGNGGSQTITNGIDLAGEGGMIWGKSSTHYSRYEIVDTERGYSQALASNTTAAQSTSDVNGVNADGFLVRHGNSGQLNASGRSYVSWTFRQHPKFFETKTFTTTYNVVPSTLTHSLEGPLGMAIFKRTDGTGNWVVWHRSLGTRTYLRLNSSASAISDPTYAPTYNEATKTFTFYYPMSNVDDRIIVGNAETSNWVGYFFAHDAGGFGVSGTENVVTCGSFTTGAYLSVTTVNLGYEPQWILVKSTADENWWMVDSMRGMPVSGTDAVLNPNLYDAEILDYDIARPTATGFATVAGSSLSTNATYIYIAIRRGPMKVPTDGTKVFAIDAGNNTGSATVPEYVSGFPVDFQIEAPTGGYYMSAGARLIQGKRFYINKPAGESEDAYSAYNFAFQNGWFNQATSGKYSYMFRRASGAFDVVCYNGNGSNQTIAHNLNAVPELIFTRRRDTTVTRNINVYNKTIGATKRFQFDYNAAETSVAWNNTEPTSSVFSVGNEMETNNSGSNYIAWMFASVPGVIKVGTYTGTGLDLNVNCGFTGGARFVLIKGVTQGGTENGMFYLWDSTRGIVSGNDPYYLLSYNAPSVTNTDYIDALASGFTVTSSASTFVNVSGNEYIFLAVA